MKNKAKFLGSVYYYWTVNYREFVKLLCLMFGDPKMRDALCGTG